MASKNIAGLRRRWCLPVFVVLSLVLAGCGASGGGGEAPGGEQQDTLTVFAAASLTDAFDELARDFEERHEGVEVRASYASSSVLATQIIQGAPADVFASADEAQMEKVADEGLVSGKPEIFARNREVVIVPKDNPANIRNFKDLSRPGIKLVLAAEEVPAAEYAEEILRKAAEDPAYGPRFRRAVLDNIVSREEDVRAAVNRVVVGDADATFGYASDVTPDIRDQVQVIEIPDDLNIVATYPIAALKHADDEELARDWVRLVLSEEGQRVLKKWGFMTISDGQA
ncbi:Molybdate-binding protein ModA [Rubrobacter xylanophilus DSM 9941]|uniref:molybdate ABC transporter substrate-binding protein n=1 Tax=Rubrobacter xylanophilus TaxID=49319 RepID=UPI001C63FB92|nr:molybdate ABC transporter substrate-binding protein [Rubrobacter xylanophilus]QYJ15704.1 Molybdate-binding protein ModA [Rubrobacter xylanophilus DSM 9941]